MKQDQYFELSFDKFHLRVPHGYWYAGYDTWVKIDGETAYVGMTDFIQTKVGDILFFTPVETDTFEQDDILGTVESIKATIEITMPVSGKVIALNPELDKNPELIAEDAYGEGWIAHVSLTNWEEDKIMLLPAEKYFELMQQKVENAR